MESLFNQIYILKYKIFWIIGGILLAANLIFYASVINGQKATIADLQKKYSNTRQLRSRDLNKKDPVHELKTARESWQEFISKLPPVTMVTFGIKELISIIDRYESSNTKLIFRPEKVALLELWKYSTEITITGEYENVRKLLAEIQNSPNLYCIEKLSMIQSKKEGKVDLTLGITTYSRLNNGKI
jgi:Tfp pilus assembly protein PilO